MRSLTDTERNLLGFFAEEYPMCWCCGWRDGMAIPTQDLPFNELQIHHLVGGSGRYHERWNLVRLCKLCHDVYHGACFTIGGVEVPQLSFENICWLKRALDPDNWSEKKIAAARIKHSQPISCEEPPEFFTIAFARNQLDAADSNRKLR